MRDPRLSVLEGMKAAYLEGPDGQQWKVDVEESPPAWLTRGLPDGALVFAENGYGDHLFLRPGRDEVFVFWHEGGEIAEYSATVGDLRPDLPRRSSDHPPITYRDTDEIVRLGDRVQIRYWLVLRGRGEVTYVPGVSPRKPGMERDGLAWVGVRLDDGAWVATIVLPDGSLKKSVRFLGRRGAGEP